MAITFVSRATSNGSTAGSTTIATNPTTNTAGNLLVALVIHLTGGVNPSTWSDTAGTTGWTFATSTSYVESNGFHGYIYYAASCGATGTNTVTLTLDGSAIYRGLIVYEFSGCAASPFDNGNAATGASGQPDPGNITVAAASDVIVNLLTMGNSPTLTAGSGYTLTQWNISGDAAAYLADQYKVVTAAEHPSVTGATSNWGSAAASFKVASGGARPLFRQSNLAGIGAGGSFFQDPLSAKHWVRRDRIYVPARMAA